MRPVSTAGTPGMVPPITPPEASSIRARYHSDGAVSATCGSFASSGAPAAVRSGAAAKALADAPRPGRTNPASPSNHPPGRAPAWSGLGSRASPKSEA